MSKPILIIVFLIMQSLVTWGQNKHESSKYNEETEKTGYIIFWEGTDPIMTVGELAAYCAPIFWFSPDEPELKNLNGKEIKIPSAFPFEAESANPVVYYQLKEILIRGDNISEAYKADQDNIGNSKIDLSRISGIGIDYNHYYKFEVGLGKHNHDTEQAQFKIFVQKHINESGIASYQLGLLQATAKAHALPWYDNIYKVNAENLNFEIKLPFHILVEEGKHASVTDMNGDGYYTPGYDVNVRTNDAWGLRDVIRTGELFSAQFEGWMAKVRKPEHQVFPPLPEDSPHRKLYSKNGEYAAQNSIYELRPMPKPENALPDQVLAHDMSGYYVEDWPQLKNVSNIQTFYDWWETENLIKSLAVAYRYNGVSGVSFTFPLLIIKNVEAPLVGGWLVNRIYLQDKKLRDFGYGILYTPSASRFLDPYFSVGLEIDKFSVAETEELKQKTDFVFETGIKFRGNVKYSPLKFLGFLTDFWGVRLGIKNKGFWSIDNLDYVFEIGAGVW